MAKTPKRPIGFGREPDPNGTGDGYKWQPGDADVPDKSVETPPRQPRVEPVFVSTIEAQQILAAYNLFPLTPLSTLEHQLLQVIAALEKRVDDLPLDD